MAVGPKLPIFAPSIDNRTLQDMNKHTIILSRLRLVLVSTLSSFAVLTTAAQTLDECQQAAESNYPLIKRYDLVGQTTGLTLANIDKGWLPQVTAYAQATAQSGVASLPDALTEVLTRQGYTAGGLKKEQYKIGVDVSQTIYDGGRMKWQKEVAHREGEVEQARVGTTLYGVRQRVNELYFGVLLLDEQLRFNEDLQALLLSSEQKVAAMVKRGTAATGDLASLQAERYGARQSAVELQGRRAALLRVLSLFVGREVTHASRPTASATTLAMADAAGHDATNRPEVTLFNKQMALLDARRKSLDVRLRPTFSAFAQGYYGYPGFDMFHDMMHTNPTLNGMLGVRVAWNIGALYSRKNDRAQIDVMRRQAGNELDVFLFNNRLETARQAENLSKYRKLLTDDDEIIRLRATVRKAAESKLAHGIIDVNDLVREIHAENGAKINRSTHEIEWLKELYDMKYTVNR